MKIGDKVYIKELQQFGTVAEVLPDGVTVSKVRIVTPEGDKIIAVLKYTIQIAVLVEALLPTIKRIFNNIKSWFK